MKTDNEEKAKVQSYGEPWEQYGGMACEAQSGKLAIGGMPAHIARAVQCVNACSGISDPAAAILEAKEALKTCINHCYSDGMLHHQTFDLQAVKSALAKLSLALSLAFLLSSCLTGKLKRIEEPAFGYQTQMDFGNVDRLTSGYAMSPFATAVFTDGRRVDVKIKDVQALRMREGQTVTLPWIP